MGNINELFMWDLAVKFRSGLNFFSIYGRKGIISQKSLWTPFLKNRSRTEYFQDLRVCGFFPFVKDV